MSKRGRREISLGRVKSFVLFHSRLSAVVSHRRLVIEEGQQVSPVAANVTELGARLFPIRYCPPARSWILRHLRRRRNLVAEYLGSTSILPTLLQYIALKMLFPSRMHTINCDELLNLSRWLDRRRTELHLKILPACLIRSGTLTRDGVQLLASSIPLSFAE